MLSLKDFNANVIDKEEQKEINGGIHKIEWSVDTDTGCYHYTYTMWDDGTFTTSSSGSPVLEGGEK